MAVSFYLRAPHRAIAPVRLASRANGVINRSAAGVERWPPTVTASARLCTLVCSVSRLCVRTVDLVCSSTAPTVRVPLRMAARTVNRAGVVYTAARLSMRLAVSVIRP